MIPFRQALFWSALSGALALAWEMLWVRLYNYMSASRPAVLGALLGSYLIGLALGALLSRRLQKSKEGDDRPVSRRLASVVFWGNLAAFLLAPVASWWAVLGDWHLSLLLVAGCGVMLGAVLPVICHYAIPPDERAGARLSYLYLANIIGCGFGSLFTAFGLMEWFGFQVISVLLLAVGVMWSESMVGFRLRWHLRVLSVAALVCSSVLFDGFYERLHYRTDYTKAEKFTTLVEGRHGVVAMDKHRVVFGNGAYDGRIDFTLLPESRNLRPYIISALHPTPEHILVVGMSSGTWTKILASNPHVRKITVVEINSGYLDLVSQVPEVAGLLHDPKVEIIIDDGRRWMRHHPEARFDVVVMNTSFHWREFATAVLSREFLDLVKSRLKPGGFAIWNCTDSGRAIRTGMEVFPNTLMVLNNCVGSVESLRPDRERWRNVLSDYQINGNPVFDMTTDSGRGKLDGVLAFLDTLSLPVKDQRARLLSRELMMQRWGHAKIITDDNMGHEFELGNW